MKRVIFVATLITLAVSARAQVIPYAVDSSDNIFSRTVTTISSSATPPIRVILLSGDGAKFLAAMQPTGHPLLIELSNYADSNLNQTFELDSVSAVLGDTLVISRRIFWGASQQLQWNNGTMVRLVNNDGIIIKQLQQMVAGLGVQLPDTTGKTDSELTIQHGGLEWTSTAASSGVTSFNTRTGAVAPASGDYAFTQINGTAAVTQGGTGLTSIVANQLIYSSATNVFSPLALGTGLSITSDTLNAVTGFSLPDTTGYTNEVLTVQPTGAVGWSSVGAGTVTSVNANGGTTGMTFLNGPIVKTGSLTLSGTLSVANGGTGGTTRAQALTNILPDSLGKTNLYLHISPSGGFDWDTAVGSGGSGAGTVTSVNVAIPGMTSSGAVTTSGTITMSGALAVANGGTALTTTPTDGQLLIGKTSTSGYALAGLTGTANEVTVTNGSGSIALSTPQAIATTSNVTFDSLTLTKALPVTSGGTGGTTYTAHGLLLGQGTTPVTDLGAATNGQIPIGSTGADPTLATITGTANEVTVTNGAGSISLSTPQAIATTSSPTFNALTLTTPLAVASGGLGNTKDSSKLAHLADTAGIADTARAAGTASSLVPVYASYTITTDTNNMPIPVTVTYARLTNTTTGVVHLTGIVSSTRPAGATLWVANVGTEPIVIQDNNAGSTAANEFQTTGGDVYLLQHGVAHFFYDPSFSRWVIIGGNN